MYTNMEVAQMDMAISCFQPLMTFLTSLSPLVAYLGPICVSASPKIDSCDKLPRFLDHVIGHDPYTTDIQQVIRHRQSSLVIHDRPEEIFLT